MNLIALEIGIILAIIVLDFIKALVNKQSKVPSVIMVIQFAISIGGLIIVCWSCVCEGGKL